MTGMSRDRWMNRPGGKPRCLVVFVLLLLGIGLSACSGEGQEGEETVEGDEAPSSMPIAEPDDAARRSHETRLTRVRFLTLRDRTDSDEPAEYFGDVRGELRSGQCEVVWTPIRGLDTIARNAPIYIPSEDLEITAVSERPLESFWSDYVRDNERSRPLLYVHGYNIGFEKGCLRAARMTENLGLGHQLLLFSWPSDGATLNYTRDQADLSWSIEYLRETLLHMEGLFGRGGFDVAAHSLGARGLSLALSGLSDGDDPETPLVERLVLFAPDIDVEIFQQILPRLGRQAGHITAYVSENDSALSVAREIHGYPRLGEAGPHLAELTGVEFVDVSELPLRRVTGHLYHLYNAPVAHDLRELLIDRLDAADRSRLKQPDPTLSNYWLLPEPPPADED